MTKKEKTLAQILSIGFCIFASIIIIALVSTCIKANAVYNLVDKNCVEIIYNTVTQKIRATDNENKEIFTIGMNGGSFGILKGRLGKKWKFTPPPKNCNIEQSFWTGIRETQSTTQN